MNRKIIIALIIIVLIVLAGLLVFSSGIKTDTKINFLSENSLKNGDQVQFELVDAQGKALANQNITITFEGNDGEKQNFTITTDSQGRGGLLLNEQADGKYNISVSYAGDEKHNGCSANQTITIGDVSENTDSTSNSTSVDSSSNTNGDGQSENSNSNGGVIQGGQNDGLDSDYINNNKPNIVNGSLE